MIGFASSLASTLLNCGVTVLVVASSTAPPVDTNLACAFTKLPEPPEVPADDEDRVLVEPSAFRDTFRGATMPTFKTPADFEYG